MTKKKVVLFVVLGILLLTNYNVYPKEENNLKEKADSCLEFMAYKDAITYYSQAIKKNPESIGLRVDKAFANFQLGKEEEAIEDLHEEITQFPKNNQAYVLLSYIYYHQNKFKEAKKTSLDFDTRLKKHFRTTEIYSRGSYQRAASLKGEFPIPNMGLPNFILGLYSKEEKKFKAAARNFAFAYQRGYNPVECGSHIIDTELVQEHWKLAIPWSRRLIKKMGSHAEFYFLW